MRIINIFVALVVAVSLCLPFHQPVYAATVTLTVTAAGTYTTGAEYHGGTLNWDNLNSDDGNTEYVCKSSGFMDGWSYLSYQMQDFVAAYSVINSVTIYAKKTSNGASQGVAGIYSGGLSDTFPCTDGYVLTSKVYNTNPFTGLAWTAAQINNLEFYINVYASWASGDWNRCTYLYAVVDYTPPVAPTVVSSAASSIAPTTATLNGEVTYDGGDTIDLYGFVWDTSDKGDPGNADPSAPPGTWTNGWKSGAGDYGENPFSHGIVGLTKGTQYFYRAAAHNSTGWEYGSAVSFTTIGDPTISIVAASVVTATTARLNANVTFDGNVLGGEACTVTFVYVANGVGAPYANYAAVLAEAGSVQVVAAGHYHTGELPYYDLSGLATSTTYSFAVKTINSTATTVYGLVEAFTTESGVSEPSNFTAIPTSTTVSLAWAKGTGAQYTLVRYSASTYPLLVTDGTLAYLGLGNSHQLTSLTPGTTYYFAAWGKTGATYSAASETVMSTTLAYDSPAASSGSIESPPANATWTQTPSSTNVVNIPILSSLVQMNQTAYGTPLNMMWYLVWILLSVGISVFIYNKSGGKLPLGLGASALMFSLGAVIGLTMMWLMVAFSVIGAGFSLWGDRR